MREEAPEKLLGMRLQLIHRGVNPCCESKREDARESRPDGMENWHLAI